MYKRYRAIWGLGISAEGFGVLHGYLGFRVPGSGLGHVL